MSTVKQIVFVSMLVCTLLSTAIAQDRTTAAIQRSSLTITAAASGERVRITAPSSVVQMIQIARRDQSHNRHCLWSLPGP